MDLPELDITDPDSVAAAVDSVRPELIVNAAALTDVDRCQLEPGEAFRVHRDGVRNLAATGSGSSPSPRTTCSPPENHP